MTADERRIEELLAEVGALQQRVAALDEERGTAERRAQLYERFFQQLPFSTVIWGLAQPDDPSSFQLFDTNALNQAEAARGGIQMRERIGSPMRDIVPDLPPEQSLRHADVLREGRTQELDEITLLDPEGNEMTLALVGVPISETHLGVIVENVTDRKRADEMMRQSIALEEALQAQNAIMAELSTPLIPISDDVVVMPLIGAVDSRRAQQVMETLLVGIAERGAETAILDITGVPVVDTQVANGLIQAAQAVRLLGAQVILTGIRAEVAQTLVGLGADLSEIVTLANLQSGIAHATQQEL
jgi:rsbT co-antagonist protein RsbR